MKGLRKIDITTTLGGIQLQQLTREMQEETNNAPIELLDAEFCDRLAQLTTNLSQIPPAPTRSPEPGTSGTGPSFNH